MLNQPLGGLQVIEGYPLYEDRTEGMGAVAAYTYGEHTVVFVGTRSGQLKKVGWMDGWTLLVDELRRNDFEPLREKKCSCLKSLKEK